jgi:WD40 repeat protein
VEMLFRCNILALVGGGKQPKFLPNKVMIWDDFQVKCIAELEFRSNVKGVKLRRDRIVVILENKVYVYNFADLKLLDQIDTYPNPKGLCALSPSSDSLVMAVPGSRAGEVRMEVITNLNNTNNNAVSSSNTSATSVNSSNIPTRQVYTIPAHNNPIHLLALDLQGKRLATCSDRGTLIRIFDTASGKKIKELRRGAQQASIQSMVFNSDGTILCVGSDKGTIHLFSVPPANLDTKDVELTHNRQWSFAFMKPIIKIAGDEYSFAQFSVPETQSICAFGQNNSVIVLGATGTYYKYSFTFDKDKVQCKEEGRDTYYLKDDD